jgi:hypothetical protein
MGPTTYYLAQGDKALAVTDGEVINNTYRINGLKGSQLSLTYLPLGIDQVLSMPAGPTASFQAMSAAPQAAGQDPGMAGVAAAPQLPPPTGSIKDQVLELMRRQNPGQQVQLPNVNAAPPSAPASVVFTPPATVGAAPAQPPAPRPAPAQPPAPRPAPAPVPVPAPAPEEPDEGDQQ